MPSSQAGTCIHHTARCTQVTSSNSVSSTLVCCPLSVCVADVPAGPDSMIVRLALAAHSKVVGAMLDMGLQQGEAAFKQHITLQVQTADSQRRWSGAL